MIVGNGLHGGGGVVFGVNRELARQVGRHRPERIGSSPSEKSDPEDLVLLDRLRKSEGGLVVQGRELGAELAIETEERPGSDRREGLGEAVVVAGVGASPEVAFHHSEVQVVAAGLKIQLFWLNTMPEKV
jgi:hypothetical protein